MQTTHQAPDVPSPIDLQAENDAREWASRAMSLRPWRADFFACIAKNLRTDVKPLRVLELGSGPGFLAEQILRTHPDVQMVLLDFSEPMHRLARERLAPFADRITHVTASFKEPGWSAGLGQFHHVVTNQAVHEMRHKRYATGLHAEVRQVLLPAGTYLVSDHHAGGEEGMKNTELYMTVEEQLASLQAAGFSSIQTLLHLRGMVLHNAA